MSDEEWAPFNQDEIDIFGNDLWCEQDYLAPFWPSTDTRSEGLLNSFDIRNDDVLYDLGCGDGRILIEAVRKGANKCIGIEYDEALVEKGKEKVREAGLEDKIEIKHGNFLEIDLSDATLIYVFLLPKAVELLTPRFVALMNAGKLRIIGSVLYELKEWPYSFISKPEIASFLYFKEMPNLTNNQ
ncbi:unnamed protein product [Blepharisma stoltei]|uniref:Methyltransferase domain-containing protein n=1 Tax=Blepharisma stoltei TaxID=1481888 RepID=A0AAU9IGI7_9CILI|nr:unnamed protein product [Blepharisma stoltei]